MNEVLSGCAVRAEKQKVMFKDFTPTKETISLHGLGFIQVKLPANQRLHVWHPELPRRNCFEVSAVHNHRFSFESRVLKGKQLNQRYLIEIVEDGTHNIISHNGPRTDKGSRESYPVAECNIIRNGDTEIILPGQSYTMDMYEYHATLSTGVVITLMTKIQEGEVHANSICGKQVDFHTDFDRFQLSPHQLYAFVADAFNS